MTTTEHLPGIFRRTLIGAAASGFSWAAVKAEVDAMKADGWTAHPVACCMCGARCGLLAMRREGENASASRRAT